MTSRNIENRSSRFYQTSTVMKIPTKKIEEKKIRKGSVLKHEPSIDSDKDIELCVRKLEPAQLKKAFTLPPVLVNPVIPESVNPMEVVVMRESSESFHSS